MTRSEPTNDTPVVAGTSFTRLVQIMARLRAPGGCPWDAEQSHHSLAIHLLEEAHETLDAIDRGDMAGLEEELGDLLLQVVFHAEIAQEGLHFDIATVVEGLVDKLIARHPHVFGETHVSGAAEVVKNWESLKAEHKGRSEIDEGIPPTLPSLLLAHKALRRLHGAGRPHEVGEDLAKKAAAFADGPTEHLLSSLLMDVVAIASGHGIDPEGALRREAKRLLKGETSEV